jgi:hypothetical protein
MVFREFAFDEAVRPVVVRHSRHGDAPYERHSDHSVTRHLRRMKSRPGISRVGE